MTRHTNSHAWERPAGQDEETRRRTLALMLYRANALPPRTGPLPGGVRGWYHLGLALAATGALALAWGLLTNG